MIVYAKNVFQRFFLFFSTVSIVAYAQSEYRQLGVSKENEDRIIIVYPLNGCSQGSLSSESASSGVSGLELQTPKGARTIALNELEKRVNLARSQKSQEFSSRRLLSPISDQETSTKLTTRYLNAIQAEIAQIPSFLSSDEMMELSNGLPCVQMVVKDYIKIVEETPTRLSSYNEASRSRYHNNKNNRAKNKCTSCDAEDDINFTFDMSPSYRNLQVNAASPNPTDRVTSEAISPNDQLFPDQWHLQESENFSIQAQGEWQEWRGSSSMVVAIIDSGCDLNHPDLGQKKWINSGEICGDGIDNDRNGYVDDCYGWDWVDNDNSPLPEGSGHGTAAAGIIAASTNNSIGIAGICWDCRIMCLRFIKGVEGRVSNQVAAIDYATKMGAKISNNSYGGYGFSRLEYEVIARSRSYGHLFVSSAGNNNYNTDLPQYDHTPSIYNLDNILAVGASTKSGKKASFSNYGKASVDFYAPGSRIVTVETGGSYAVVSGTSFAAPMASGVAALVWSRFPSLSNTEIIKALTSSCKQTESLNGLAVCGGILNVNGAIAAAGNMVRFKSGSNFVRGNVAAVQRESANTNKKVFTPAAGPVAKASSSTGEATKTGSTNSNLNPSSQRNYTGWLGAFISGVNKALTNTQSVATVSESSDSNSSTKDTTTVEASGIAGRTIKSPDAVVIAVKDKRLKESLHSPYLLFNGVNEAGEKVEVDPLFLNNEEFNNLILRYENAFGLKKNGDSSEEASSEASEDKKSRLMMTENESALEAASETVSEIKKEKNRLNGREGNSSIFGLLRLAEFANNGIDRGITGTAEKEQQQLKEQK